MSLARQVWIDRARPSLEDVLRADPELRERCKANGFFLDTIARIEAEERR